MIQTQNVKVNNSGQVQRDIVEWNVLSLDLFLRLSFCRRFFHTHSPLKMIIHSRESLDRSQKR
jgi:hypothetical protein